MISYAGVSLTLPTPELMELLERAFPVEELMVFHTKWTQEAPEGCPPMDFGRPYTPQVSELYWPTQAHRWAAGHFLATDEQLACIRSAIGASMFNEFVMWDAIGGNTTTTSTTTTTGSITQFSGPSRFSAQLAIVNIHPIFDVATSQKLNLLTFVDRRYFWWYKSCPSATPTTWTGLWEAALTAAGVGSLSRTIETIPLDYGTPSGRWKASRWKGFPLPTYLDAAAQMTQRRVVCRPDETVIVQGPDNKLTLDNINYQIFSSRLYLGGQASLREIERSQPSRVKVVFFSTSTNECTAEPLIEEVTLASLTTGGTSTTSSLVCAPTTTSTTTTTPAGTPCRYLWGYDALGELWGPEPYEDNPACCPDVPFREGFPAATGAAASFVSTYARCPDPTTTSTTCAGTTTTTNAYSPPSLPEYEGLAGVSETSVFLWADSSVRSYSLARRLARDWYLWRLSQVEAAYTGPINWPLQGLTEGLIYRHTTSTFDTRVLRMAPGIDNVVAAGVNCLSQVNTTSTTTTTTACTGTAVLVNNNGVWAVESSTCSCGCSPDYPPFCPSTGCNRLVVQCTSLPSTPPACTTTTTPYVGPPTTTTTPFCPTTTSTTTTTPACTSNKCVYWIGPRVGGGSVMPVLISAGCCPSKGALYDAGGNLIYPACELGSGCCNDLPNNLLYNCGFCDAQTAINLAADPANECSTVEVDCLMPSCEDPSCFCGGYCRFVADPVLGVWIPIINCSYSYTCCPDGILPGSCLCSPPSLDPRDFDCGAEVTTPCTSRSGGTDPNNDPCNPVVSTTTTPAVGPCDSSVCRWSAALAGDPWTLDSSDCPVGCGCQEPAYVSTVDCETAVTYCGRNITTTTSTTTTTTTTTTTLACTGGCLYLITYDADRNRTNIAVISNTCSVGCDCPYEPADGGTPIPVRPIPGTQIVSGNCESGSFPTTTTTTTTPGPVPCAGACIISWNNDSVVTFMSGCGSAGCGCEVEGTVYNVGDLYTGTGSGTAGNSSGVCNTVPP